MENDKNKKSVKFQGDMLKFCDFIQVFVFTTNHHLNCILLITITTNCAVDGVGIAKRFRQFTKRKQVKTVQVSGSNTDCSFTTVLPNSFLSPFEKSHSC